MSNKILLTNTKNHIPPPISTWVKGATYSSATALAVSTVAMTVLLVMTSSIGSVAFSITAGTAAVSALVFSTCLCLLNRNPKEPNARSPSRIDTPRSCEESESDEESNGNSIPAPGESRTLERLERNAHPLVHAQTANRNSHQPSSRASSSREITSTLPPKNRAKESSKHVNVTPQRQAASIVPQPILIDEFRESLSPLFTAGKKFLAALLKNHDISAGKEPNQEEIQRVENALDSLSQVVSNILQDNRQLLRIALAVLTSENSYSFSCSFLYSYVNEYSDLEDFLHTLPSLSPRGYYDYLKESLARLFSEVARNAKTDDVRTKIKLHFLYKRLHSKANDFAKAHEDIIKERSRSLDLIIRNVGNLACSQEPRMLANFYEEQIQRIAKYIDRTNADANIFLGKLKKAQKAQKDFIKAFRDIMDSLFLKCPGDIQKGQLNDLAALAIPLALDKIRKEVWNILPKYLEPIQKADCKEGLLSSLAPIQNQISSLPLYSAHKKALDSAVQPLKIAINKLLNSPHFFEVKREFIDLALRQLLSLKFPEPKNWAEDIEQLVHLFQKLTNQLEAAV